MTMDITLDTGHSPDAPPVTAYFWVTTLHGYKDGSLVTSTVSGSANLPSGCSRSAAFRGAVAEARRIIGFSDDEPDTVLFFSLEPEEML